MNLFDTTQLALERAMSGATLRHEALAANLANANTPGYKPLDVDFHGVLRDALKRGPGAVERAELAPVVDSHAVMRADGNGVDVDVTAAEIAENGLELSAITKVAGARLDILRLAMGTR